MCLGSAIATMSCCRAVGDGAGPGGIGTAQAVGVGVRLMRGAPGSAVLREAMFAGKHEAQPFLRHQVPVRHPGASCRAGTGAGR